MKAIRTCIILETMKQKSYYLSFLHICDFSEEGFGFKFYNMFDNMEKSMPIKRKGSTILLRSRYHFYKQKNII